MEIIFKIPNNVQILLEINNSIIIINRSIYLIFKYRRLFANIKFKSVNKVFWTLPEFIIFDYEYDKIYIKIKGYQFLDKKRCIFKILTIKIIYLIYIIFE